MRACALVQGLPCIELLVLAAFVMTSPLACLLMKPCCNIETAQLLSLLHGLVQVYKLCCKGFLAAITLMNACTFHSDIWSPRVLPIGKPVCCFGAG